MSTVVFYTGGSGETQGWRVKQIGPALSFWETTHKNDLDSIHLHDKHRFSQIILEKRP